MDTICWFMIRARPQPDIPEAADIAGAFINAYVAHSDEAIAEQVARDAIEEQRWRIEEVEHQAVLTPDACGPDEEHREYFDQALADGHCLVFHCWPPEGEESEDDAQSA